MPTPLLDLCGRPWGDGGGMPMAPEWPSLADGLRQSAEKSELPSFKMSVAASTDETFTVGLALDISLQTELFADGNSRVFVEWMKRSVDRAIEFEIAEKLGAVPAVADLDAATDHFKGSAFAPIALAGPLGKLADTTSPRFLGELGLSVRASGELSSLVVFDPAAVTCLYRRVVELRSEPRLVGTEVAVAAVVYLAVSPSGATRIA